ncbi:hypothetical protein RB195_000644 [Necator americanus]|uniref:glucuronosyltransferase n=1 Tax=Necator americanus TaxID=51031 RepID=A0ABR1DAQ4_NECAM
MISNGRIADELALAGHDVVLFEPDFLNVSHTVNPVKFARRWQLSGFSSVLRDVLQEFSGAAFEQISKYEEQKGLLRYERAFNELCEDLINRESVMEELQGEQFDAYFGEQINLCGNGLAYALGIKSHFWVSSCPLGDYQAWVLGIPQPSSYIPSIIGMDMTTQMSYLERVQNIYSTALFIYMNEKSAEETSEVFRRKYGANFPSVSQIAANSDMIFVSTDEFVEFPRPTLPNVVHIGGLGLRETLGNDPLEEPLHSEMEKGARGVVYFSLGTLVNTTSLPHFAMISVVDMVKQTPDYHFILVIDKNDQFTRKLAKDVKNVYICSWTPQPAILKHPRLCAFITHGGYNSVMEASRAAVPLITIPFMFDQIRNSRAVELTGWGIPLSRHSLRDDPQRLTTALHELLNNEKYKKAAVRISTLIRTKPFNATERLVKFTEFVLLNGGMKELLVEGRNIPFIKYHNLDIFIPIGIIFLLICYISLRLFITFLCTFTFKKEKLQ